MRTKRSRRSRRADAFISHASEDSGFVATLVKALESDGLKAWLDDADMRFGVLLRKALQSAICECRVLVLVWSKAASNSRWVMAEMFTALHSGRFIVPCVLDRTPCRNFYKTRHGWSGAEIRSVWVKSSARQFGRRPGARIKSPHSSPALSVTSMTLWWLWQKRRRLSWTPPKRSGKSRSVPQDRGCGAKEA
jgi:TIR domain